MSDTDQLNNKIAIVTGGSSGYGIGIAKMLKRAGATVWISGRNENRLKKVSTELKIHYKVSDITSPEDWDGLIGTVIKEHGSLDILVNNAGNGVDIADITDQSDENIKHSIEVNLMGAIYGSKRAAKLMVPKKSGSIINISSICSVQAWPGWSVYSAAKAGLEQFSRALYVDMRPHQVRAMYITPSWGNTSFNKAADLPDFDAEIAQKVIQPDDLGKIVVDACTLPAHLVIPEMIVLPLVQEIVPY